MAKISSKQILKQNYVEVEFKHFCKSCFFYEGLELGRWKPTIACAFNYSSKLEKYL